MVFSKIKQSINYEENTTIELLDKNMNFNVYEHTLLGIDVELCVGNINNVNKIYNVLFCPVYLVKTNNNVIKIGIIEFTPIQMSYIFDEHNEIDLDNVDILLYSGVTTEYINSIIGNDDHVTVDQSKLNTKSELSTNLLIESTIKPTNEVLNNNVINTDVNIPNNNNNKNSDNQETLNKKPRLNIINANEIQLNLNNSCKKSRKNKIKAFI